MTSATDKLAVCYLDPAFHLSLCNTWWDLHSHLDCTVVFAHQLLRSLSQTEHAHLNIISFLQTKQTPNNLHSFLFTSWLQTALLASTEAELARSTASSKFPSLIIIHSAGRLIRPNLRSQLSQWSQQQTVPNPPRWGLHTFSELLQQH